MLAKDLDPFSSDIPRELAGRRAEEQMAFYLKRQFQAHPDIWVFNGLRFEYEGIYSQIDHLLLTKLGFFVVESKSVTTRVRVSETGEWERFVDGDWKGMASPLLQGEAQLLQLLRLLCDNASTLMGRWFGIQKGYGGFHREVYCAVSDNGIIERPAPDAFPFVQKADQVCATLTRRYADLSKKTGLRGFLSTTFSRDDPPLEFAAEDLLRTKDWLLAHHRPIAQERAQEVVRPESVSSILVTDKSGVPAHPPKRYFCAKCHAGISFSVASFCWNNKGRFGGKAYCIACQKTV